MSDTQQTTDPVDSARTTTELLAIWDREGTRSSWTDVLAKAPTTADPEQTREIAERELAGLADSNPLLALRANRELVQLLIGRRWYVVREARESGDSWEAVGEALGISAADARDYYRTAIERQQKYVPDFHDHDRSRRALDDIEGDR